MRFRVPHAIRFQPLNVTALLRVFHDAAKTSGLDLESSRYRKVSSWSLMKFVPLFEEQLGTHRLGNVRFSV